MAPTITLHVVSSLDGFIASKDNTVAWMDEPPYTYDKGATDDATDREWLFTFNQWLGMEEAGTLAACVEC